MQPVCNSDGQLSYAKLHFKRFTISETTLKITQGHQQYHH